MSTTPSPTPFDAGNDFAPSAEAVAAELSTPEPEVAPETPEAPEADEATERAAWEDQTEAADETPVPETPKAPAAPATLEVKGAKGVQKFNLTESDPVLKRTLEFGLVAPVWKKERDLANIRATEAEAKVKPLAEKAARVDEVGSLTQAGFHEQAARVALGEDAFDKLVTGLVAEALEYAEADPARRAEIERSRDGRTRAYDKYKTEAEMRKKDQRLEELESSIETKRLTGHGTLALKANDFRKVIKDPDVAHNLNQKLWKLAWADLEEMAEAGKDVTEADIDRAFSVNAKVLRSVIQRQTATEVTKTIETKKADAKTKAQAVATQRYPQTQGPDLSKWDGKAGSLLKLLNGK